MRQSFDTLPRFEDHFPKLRRGHGSTHTRPRFDRDGVKVRNANPCVHEGCKGAFDDNSKKNHFDQAANIKDWKDSVRYAE